MLAITETQQEQKRTKHRQEGNAANPLCKGRAPRQRHFSSFELPLRIYPFISLPTLMLCKNQLNKIA